jgi:hypothetical protein
LLSHNIAKAGLPIMPSYRPIIDFVATCPTCGASMKGYTPVNREAISVADGVADDSDTFVADPCGHPFASISFPLKGTVCTVRPLQGEMEKT